MIPYKAKATSANVNNAFMSRTADTTTTGKVGLSNTDPASGSGIVNLQRAVNSFASAMGMSTADVYNFLFTWASNDVGTATDTIKQRIDALVAKFSITGHAHTGVAGDAPKISSSDFANFNNFFSSYASTTFNGASGLTTDVSTAFTGKTPGGSTAAYGVVTIAPNNKVDIIHADDGTWIENGNKRVYAYLTESAGVWTLTYYYRDNLNVEQPYNLPTHNLIIIFREVFSAATRPTFDSSVPSDVITMDITSDVADASPTQRGLVNTVAQAFAGEKSFADFRSTANLLASQSNDSGTTGANATITAPSTPIVRLTNAALTSVDMLAGQMQGRFLVLVNATGADVVINNDIGATPAQRILTGTGGNLTFKDGASLWFMYDGTESRWRIVGGSGGGGVEIVVDKAAALALARAEGKIYFAQAEQIYFIDDGTDLYAMAFVPTGTGNNELFIWQTDFMAPLTNGNEGEVLQIFGGSPTWLPPKSGLKNYFPKGNAESGSYGSVYADGTSEPVDGNGGTPTATVALDGTAPLQGSSSFRYTSGALGDGYSADSNVMDREDFTKIYRLKVSYKLVSGTYADGDLKLFILDTANSNAKLMITPDHSLPKPSSNGDSVEMFVQLPVQTTLSALRFCLHQTTTATFVMDFEFGLVESQFAGFGPITTDPKALTSITTGGLGTLSNEDAYWLQSGKFFRMYGTATVGTPAASDAYIELPNGLQIDSDSVGANEQHVVGYVNTPNGAFGTSYQPIALFIDLASANNRIYFGYQKDSGAFVKSNGNDIFNASYNFVFDFEVPIKGWSSETKVISEYDGRAVELRVHANANLLTSAATPIVFNTVDKDSHGIYNLSNGEIKIPRTGGYSLKLRQINSLSEYYFVYVNGVKVGGALCWILNNGYIEFGSGDYDFEKNDIVTIRNDTGQTLNVASGYYYPTFELHSIPGSQKIIQGSRILAKYYSSSSHALTANTTPVNFDTKNTAADDTHNAVTTGSNWKFKAPESRDYLVTSTINLTGSAAFFYASVTGSQTRKEYLNGAPNVVGGTMAAGAFIIPMAKDDELQILSDSATTISSGLGGNGQLLTHIAIRGL